MRAMDFEKLFEAFKNVHVAVIGDVMLDTYWLGKVDRISPEAPVPVVAVTKREERIGGAANVALNLQALGARVNIISVVGEDDAGNMLTGLLHENGIHTDYLIKSNGRITTNKIRIISRNQQMMRLDAELTNDLNSVDEEKLLLSFNKYIAENKPVVVILEDYNKGVLTENSIRKIIDTCKSHGIITAVDPKRKNFFSYTNADIFKPNLLEAREGLNILQETVNLTFLESIHNALNEKLHHKISLITLSEKGVYVQESNNKLLIPSHIRKIADVSGAGDTVIAVAAIVYAITSDIKAMAEISNVAGGLVCESVGTVAINKEKLLEECKRLLP